MTQWNLLNLNQRPGGDKALKLSSSKHEAPTLGPYTWVISPLMRKLFLKIAKIAKICQKVTFLPQNKHRFLDKIKKF